MELLTKLAEKLRGQKVQPKPIKSSADLVYALVEFGDLERKLTAIQHQIDANYAQLIQERINDAMPLARRLKELSNGIELYAHEHRETLLEDTDGKTVNLGVAKIQFIKNPDRVVFTKGHDEVTAIEELKALGLLEFIQVEEKLLKNVIKAKWTEIKDKVSAFKVGEGKERVQIVVAETDLSDTDKGVAA